MGSFMHYVIVDMGGGSLQMTVIHTYDPANDYGVP